MGRSLSIPYQIKEFLKYMAVKGIMTDILGHLVNSECIMTKAKQILQPKSTFISVFL